MFDGKFRVHVDKYVRPVGVTLTRTKITPDHLTVVGLLISIAAAVTIGAGYLRVGLLLVIAAALPDMLDGALAKASNVSSQRGAFFDSTIDRITDSFMLGGVAWYLGSTRGGTAAVLPFAVMAVSSLISYQRAKAESLGLQAKGGLMERAERIVILCVGLLFDSGLYWVMWAMLVLVSVTAVQRFIKIWRQAAVAPVVAERMETRRSRRASRRAAFADRRSRISSRRRDA
ncbi:MAG: CDP-alcohol phosphatidyltransferase family protein [Ilumatobacteraceae bacterium]|nr:putative phosphatidylinositol synthase PgsA [Actinomycetes bacterium]